MTSRVYRTIVADPPWPYTGTTGVNRGAKAGTRALFMPYVTMTLTEIRALQVPAEDDAHLFLWTTQRYLDDAFDVVRAWGFRPSSTLTWCKTPVGIGPGGLFAVTSEFVIYGRRGSRSTSAASRRRGGTGLGARIALSRRRSLIWSRTW